MTEQTASRGYRSVRTGLFLGLVVAVLSGCVSSGKYEDMVAERDGLMEERDNLVEKEAMLSSQVAETEQQKKAATMKAKEAEGELARQQQVYDNLQSTFAKEQKTNQVKIELMKSGIKVNLANEILFSSGSADLNASGVEVLTRAAAELKQSPYQTIVAGYTDDIAISGKLKGKYPSNWELAGARAASVVRLLEQEGVMSAQLLAISFGQNNPVAMNDTPEGRSKNRRIEIILRPVAVTMN
ncbi:MAG: OmpA family protein [Halopseudomonas sp.]